MNNMQHQQPNTTLQGGKYRIELLGARMLPHDLFPSSKYV